MAIDIIVSRTPGDKPGPDIVEGILSDVVIAIVRGTQEINDSEPSTSVTLQTNFRTGVRTGDIAEVLDIVQGHVWRGKIIGITHTVQEANVFTDLDIEKPIRYNP